MKIKYSYNTVAFGTPGTPNACVYFYTANSVNIYPYCEENGYEIGSLYNKIYVSDVCSNILSFVDQLDSTSFNKPIENNDKFGYKTSISNNTLLIGTQNNYVIHYNISNDVNIVFDNNNLYDANNILTQYSNNITDYGINVYNDNTKLLITCKITSDNTRIVLHYIQDNNNWILNNSYKSSEVDDKYGESIVRFNTKYIVGAYESDKIYIHDIII